MSVRARAVLGAATTLLVAACAGKQFLEPAAFDDVALRARAQSVVEDGIRASATIPSREEALAIFGVDLLERGVQPVWLEIRNDTDRALYFLRTGLDPEYFSPRETAFALSESMSDEGRRGLIEHIEALDFRDPIEPRSAASGFVLTNKDRESKFVGIDLVSPGWSAHLSLVVPNPDRTISEDRVAQINARVASSKAIPAQDQSELRELLENLPCCTTDENGVQGEPLNVIIVGNVEATGSALIRRGFRYQPADPLYAFGRPQDLSIRKGATWVAAQPHVLRVWLTDIRYKGKLVWIGQISMPLGGRFADDDAPARIDPDVDASRNDFLQDGLYSQLLSEIGFVKGGGFVSRTRPRVTPGGSTYHTDGLRAVLFYVEDPVSLNEIELIGWERLLDHLEP